MSNESQKATITSEALINNFLLFSLLGTEEIQRIFLLTKEISVKTGEVIVREGDLIDSFYFIQSGTAEVTKMVATVEKKQNLHIAFLGEGDSIGLTESGFFSSTGIRCSTVTAQSPMILLTFNVKAFDDFLKSFQVYYPALKDISEKILLMHLIKALKSFQHLSNIDLKQLVFDTTRKFIPAGQLLFKEGDDALDCYILLSGVITIFTMVNQQKTILNELKPQLLFGEAAFLEAGKRNASAESKTDCTVIYISMNLIEKILKTGKLDLDFLKLSRIEQLRPKAQEGITVHSPSSTNTQTLSLPTDGNHNQIVLTNQEYLVWQELDGRNSLLNIHKKYNFLSVDEIYTFVIRMTMAGFLKMNEIETIKSGTGFMNYIKIIFNRIKLLWK